MVTPAPRLVLLAAALAPAALLLAVLAPAAWAAVPALLLLLALLALLDWLMAAKPAALSLSATAPEVVGIGQTCDVQVALMFAGRRAPASADVAIGASPLLERQWAIPARMAMDGVQGKLKLPHRTVRRGTADLGRLWCRWRGPLGLVRIMAARDAGLRLAIVPDIRPLRIHGARLMAETRAAGLLARRQAGPGTDFEALAEFRPGMDRRHIDWKHSARHRTLLAKEFQAETNNNLMLAVDCGRSMADPIGGLPRLDHAIAAALLTARIALAQGDRVGLAAFDSQPRLNVPPIAGGQAWPTLQQAAARIDYATRETNFTLGLSAIATRLSGRAHLVLFTEFADATGARLMLDAVAPLVRRYLVIFVVLRQAELEGIAGTPPASAEDVTRAATAGALLRSRQLVIAELQQRGVHVLEASYDDAGPALVRLWTRLARGQPA